MSDEKPRGALTVRVGEMLPLSAGPDALRRAGSGGLEGRLVLSTGA